MLSFSGSTMKNEPQKNTAEEQQQKYMEMQIISQQIKQLQRQIQILQSQISEVNIAVESFNELKNVKKGAEILVPITNGVFAKAELKDSSHLLVNVGANTVVTKTIDESKKLMEDQLNELAKFHDNLVMEIQKLSNKLEELEKDLSGMIG